MEWYVWVLIAVAAVGIGALKLTILNKWMESRKLRRSRVLEEE